MSLPVETQAAILAIGMDSVRLDLERARMEREDFRQGNSFAGFCFSASGKRPYTWRQDNVRKVGDLDEATRALLNLRDELRDMDGHVPMDLADNYNQMLAEVSDVLGSDDELQSESDSEESATSLQ